MESIDIGIDLGTTSVLVYRRGKGIVLREPAVIAYNEKTDKVVAVGTDASVMVGKTPAYIHAVFPLKDGVVSDYKMAQDMIAYFLKKCSHTYAVKPRVALCVPSKVTGVEAQAVVNAAVNAGARKVYLIEEPVAAAIGAGLDILKPCGRLIVDIGGGTADAAVLSLGGIVVKNSVRIAGRAFDDAIIRYVRNTYNIQIGSPMAEQAKISIGDISPQADSRTDSFEVRGQDMSVGMPGAQVITPQELAPGLRDTAMDIVHMVHSVLEQTPPELIGDIYESGLMLTGGGGLLRGLDDLLSEQLELSVVIAPHPEECVVIGTGECFRSLDQLVDGFLSASTHKH